MAEHLPLDKYDEEWLSLFSDMIDEGNLTAGELSYIHPLTHIEMAVQSYAIPAVLLASSISLLLTLTVLFAMTWRVRDVHAYYLVACLTDLVALTLDQRMAGWVSNVVGQTTHYAHRLMHLSAVSCICTNYVIGCARQLPRYMLVALALDCSVTQRVPRFVRHLTWNHVKDMIIVNVVLTLIANIHYFWTYDLTELPLTNNNRLYWHRACRLRIDIDQSSNMAVYRIGYMISGYTWLVEHFVPFIVLTACCVVMATSRRGSSQAVHVGLTSSALDGDHVIRETADGRQIHGTRMTSSRCHDNMYSELVWGDHTKALVVHTTPYLAAVHIVCSLLTVIVWPVKSLVLVNNDRLLNSAGMILVETLAKLLILTLPTVNFVVLLTCHTIFRRHTCHLLALLPKRLRHLYSRTLKPATETPTK